MARRLLLIGGMTLPRPVIAGSTAMSTRRCTQRQYWLRPSKKTNRILLYCLAVAAERTGLQLHSFCCMSNHEHNVATDPLGKRPEFHHLFHTFVTDQLAPPGQPPGSDPGGGFQFIGRSSSSRG